MGFYIFVASSCFASFVAAWDAQQGSTLSPTSAPRKTVKLLGWRMLCEAATCVENTVPDDQADDHADEELHWVSHRHLRDEI